MENFGISTMVHVVLIKLHCLRALHMDANEQIHIYLVPSIQLARCNSNILKIARGKTQGYTPRTHHKTNLSH